MEWLRSIDVAVLLFIQEHFRVEWLNGFWKMVSFLGNKGWFWILLVLVLIMIKRTRTAGMTALYSLALCSFVTNIIIKPFVARMRPFDTFQAVVPLIAEPLDYSFPSGHTTAAFACAMVLYRMLPGKYGAAAMALAALIAYSRLYLGVHYPSDVIGGFLMAWAGSAAVLSRSRWKESETAPDRREDL